jgi:adsorption protein B
MGPEVLDSIAQGVAGVVAAGIAVNVNDDLFVDICYFACGLHRKESRTVSESALRNVEQKRIAIMVPAWKESDVIEQMLEHNVAKLDYDRDRYDIFCGTYQNDPETQARVAAVERRFGNVHQVVVPHDGPTSKADCLNWVYQGIIVEEQKRGQRFDIILMQDAEDIIHPLALRLYSLLIPPNEFVQTPVFSLPLPMSNFVSGTYIDEFAEHHLKDMRVREAIGGLIPSAGVGSAFARDAFEEIAAAHGQEPFNVKSLTEDYEIGLKFRLANRKTHFACRTVDVRTDSGFKEEFIATREFFPSGFSASVRQRSRWILGITLQTWSEIGWRGALPVLYCLWRDRKALVTNALLLSAYLLVAYVGVRSGIAWADGDGWKASSVVPAHSFLAWLLLANVMFAVWRLFMKARLVGKLYGAGHAALSVPRLVLANLIGIVATARAVNQYCTHRLTGQPLRWLKTSHAFPCAELLVAARRRLGEFLLDQRAVTQIDLEEALALHRATGARLGDVLAASGVVPQRTVTEALARQFEVEPAELSADSIPLSLLRRLPEGLAEELDVLALEERDGAVAVAVSEPLSVAARDRLGEALGLGIVLRLAPRDALQRARERAYRRLVSDRPTCPAPQHAQDAAECVDRGALARLGLGFCAFHGVVPVRGENFGPPRVLCAAPLHESARSEIVKRLRETPVFDTTTPVAVRFALALVQGSIPTVVDDMGLFGLDAVEWRAVKAELAPRRDLVQLVRDAMKSGFSPLDYLERIKFAAPDSLARARAHAFGLKLSPAGASAVGLLPPRLIAAHDVTLLRRDEDFVDLAAPRPTPRLAQQVASLLSPLKVAWSVAPSERSRT